MSIYTEFASIRRAHKLTQQQLAERAQVSRMTVVNVEAGKDIQLSTLQELAKALGVELMLVPRALRPELENFVRSGGRLVGQTADIGAPASVVGLLAIPSEHLSPAGKVLKALRQGDPKARGGARSAPASALDSEES